MRCTSTPAPRARFTCGSHTEGWKPACGVQSFEPFQRDVLTMGFDRNVELSTDWAAGNGMEMLTITGTGSGRFKETATSPSKQEAAITMRTPQPISITPIGQHLHHGRNTAGPIEPGPGHHQRWHHARVGRLFAHPIQPRLGAQPLRLHAPHNNYGDGVTFSTSMKPSSTSPNASKPWSEHWTILSAKPCEFSTQ